jgi:hypothetical protein
MRFSTLALGLLAAVSPVLGEITTTTRYASCWTAVTTSTTMATPIATTTSTLPLTTTVTERKWLISNSAATYTMPAWNKRAEEEAAEAEKRGLTIVVSDECKWFQTATAVQTFYTTDPKLTSTATVFKATVTTQTIVQTFL